MRQLPAAPVRLALPWGDSAYTSLVVRRWLPGDPEDQGGISWAMGPLTNGLTPSCEGPRRRVEVEAQAIARLADRARSKRLDRLLASWGDTDPTWQTRVDRREDWADVPYAGPMPSLKRGDRVGWTDQHGVIHTGVITDRRETARGTVLDFAPDEEGSTP